MPVQRRYNSRSLGCLSRGRDRTCIERRVNNRPCPIQCKSNPHLVCLAIDGLHTEPRCIIGDSTTDTAAAHAAGAAAIAFANDAFKHDQLAKADPEAIVNEITHTLD
ncbi:MAG: HAD hydrolase-like protein [Pseudonocardia sp.]